jgi:hypothetical protein
LSRTGLIAVLLLSAFAVISESRVNPLSSSVVLPASASEAQIQKTLDQLPVGGEVILSPGIYEISKPLLLSRNTVTLRGSGRTTILHLANGANCPVIILGPALNEPQHPAAHLTLSSLLIDGNRKNQKTEHWKSAGDGSQMNNDGVEIWNASDVTVEHVVCCRCRSGGLVTAKVRRLQVTDFDAFDNHYDGLACYETEQSHFDALRLHDNLAAGISIDLNFNHNVVRDAVLSCNDLGIFMRDSNDNTFEGLTIARSRHDGVFMAQAVCRTAKGWRLSPNTECTGNSFDSLTVKDCGGRAFEVNDATCVKNVIQGAHFLHNVLGGLCQPVSQPVKLMALPGVEFPRSL